MKALNPHTLPLHGRQVIEASAGTGKTWTLAALYLRLVLGHKRTVRHCGLPPGRRGLVYSPRWFVVDKNRA